MEVKASKTRDHGDSSSHLDLKALPPVYVLPAHLSLPELHALEEQLNAGGARLTYDIAEAKIVLGAISNVGRAKLELRCRKLWTKDIEDGQFTENQKGLGAPNGQDSRRKRQRLSSGTENSRSGQIVEVNGDSSTESESGNETTHETETKLRSPVSQGSSKAAAVNSVDAAKLQRESLPFTQEEFEGKIKVVKLDWLRRSVDAGRFQPLKPFTIYDGYVLLNPEPSTTSGQTPRIIKRVETPASNTSPMESIVQAAVGNHGTNAEYLSGFRGKRIRTTSSMRKEFSHRSFASSTQGSNQRGSHPPALLRLTTSEHDDLVSHSLPEMPQWVKDNKRYSCERVTPLQNPNYEFVGELKKIKLARLLTGDEIGVRAYSTSIASLAAYPHTLSNTQEILALPGCDQKIAHLFHEWQTSAGHIQAVAELDNDPVLKVLCVFYEIWGVGAVTAREFYYDRGWRDLDDIVERGWQTLGRVQQIGVKYYEEFELKIPRSEVEAIALVVTEHAKTLLDDRVQCAIVGGYRRGKVENGDVDIVLSHPDEHATLGLINPLVQSLEQFGWITHTLTLNETNSKRNQETLPFISSRAQGGGFDSLDKALVVWQDPTWITKAADLAADPKAKNPNVHRRVDIIITPWRTVGCAVAGWSGGTTFQRDLRRYAKHVKGWKFDSSGVRERGTGRWIDLEGWMNEDTRVRTWQEAEKRVFAGLELDYLEPWERCTG
ncbi:hypothetical protein MMC20_002097 [Loxospora ochrophaea]|nr:hypothetical protein [Loxospora ochrophaea]